MRGIEADAPPGSRGREIPVLPFRSNRRTFQILARFLDLPDGAGLRFVTRLDPGGSSVQRGELIYLFQGLSRDGALWISVRAPLAHAALTAYERAMLVPDQVPSEAQTAAQFDALLRRLSEDAQGFQPKLEALDRMVESIRVDP